MDKHTSAHTPAPWTYDHAYRELVRQTGDGDYQPIGAFHNAPTPEDIEFLLRAVNAHDLMLDTLRGLKDYFDPGPELDAIEKAIAKTGERK